MQGISPRPEGGAVSGTKKPVLDISHWTKVRIGGKSCVHVEGCGFVLVGELMKVYRVIDYQIVDGKRTNPSGEPTP